MTETAIERATGREAIKASRLSQVTGFSDPQIALISQTVAPGATRLELAWYLYNARRLGLQPTLKQIYFVRYKEGEPGEIVVGIDGFRACAESSGVYAGSDDPVFEYQEVGQPQGAPSKATVTVWKLVGGQRVPFTASARWVEFYPGDGKRGEQYRKRPHNQLAVRAESHALRKGFPYQTQALVTHAEAPQAWQEAAQADLAMQADPEVIALNAQKYDRIFGPEDQQQPVTSRAGARGASPPRRAEAQAAAAPPLPPEPASEPIDDDMGEYIDADEREIERQRKQEGLL